MLTRQTCFLIFLFLISQPAFSNSKLIPGYYVRLNGDTIRCKIEFNDRSTSPNTIHVEVNSAMQEFSSRDIKAFGIDDYGDYISAMVSYHTNPISGNNIPDHFSDSTVSTSHFIKILNRGYYSLYGLVLPERVYFFISVHDSSLSELVYRVKNVNDTLIYDAAYKTEMFHLFEKEGILYKYLGKVNDAPYTSWDLQHLISILNENYSGDKYSQKSPGRFQIQAFIGGIRNSFSGDIIYLFYTPPAHFPPTYALGGGLNFLYSIPGQFDAFKVGLSIGYNGYNNQLITPDNKYTLTATNSLLQTNLYFLYVFNPLSKAKFYMKAGAGYNFSLSSDVNVNRTASGTVIETSVKTYFFSFVAAAGVIIGRSTLEFSYSPYSQLADVGIATDSPPGKDFKLSTMAVYYYFSLFPVKN